MSSDPLVLIATSAGFPGLHETERSLLPALQKRGIDARAAVWTDPAIDWSAARLVLIRSTWDYFVRYAEFLPWIDRVSAVTQLFNPPLLVRWNSHKKYLRDLSERGVPVVETVYLTQGDQADLKSVLQARGWTQAVVKPAVSGGARGTFRVHLAELAANNQTLQALLAEGDAMVQPYLRSVGREGEVAAIFIDGNLTHGVSRPSMLEHGPQASDGSVRRELSAEELAFATHALSAVDLRPLYARVDMVRADDGTLRLLELEVIEPSLFLGLAPEAVEALATAVAQRAKSSVG